MPAQSRRDLFLQVSANTDNFTAAMKAGRSVLNEFGVAANDTTAEVEKAFQKLGGGSIEQSAKSIEQSYARTFAAIRANAAEVAAAPTGAAALQVLNSGAAQQAAAAAEAQAAGLRLVADAAARAASANTDDASAARVYATAAEAAAIGAEKQALALRAQAGVVGGVEAELRAAGAAEEALTEAHGRLGASGQILQHVVRSTTDSFAAGLPPTMIFAEQIGRLGEAAALSGPEGALGKYAGFLTGGWGIALTVGVSVLGSLIGKFMEAGDTVDAGVEKLKQDAEQTELTRQAKEAFAKSADGVAAAIRDSTDATRKAIDADKDAAEAANIAAKQNLQHEISIRNVTKALLEQQLAQQAAVANTTSGGVAGTATYAQGVVDSKVIAIRQKLAEQDANMASAQARVQQTRIDLATESAKRAADPIARINKLYDDQARAARDAARANGNVTTALTAQLTAIENNHRAALKAEQDRASAARRKPSATANNDIGRVATVADATAIIQSIGGHVTSGLRSHASQERLYADKLAGRHDGPVAVPGTSDHERGQAIDVAFGPGISVASIKAAFAKQGVAIHQILTERAQGVFHVGFNAKGPNAATVEHRRQAIVAKDANDDRAYQQQLAQAQSRVARAQLSLADTAEGRLKVQIDDLRMAQAQRNAELDDQVTAGKITKVQADRLKGLEADAEFLSEIAAKRQTQQAILDRQLQAGRDQLAGQMALLNLQGDLEVTNRGRKAIALRLLADQERDARMTAQRDTESDDPVRQRRGQEALAQIDAEHPYREAQINRQFASPMDQYRDRLQRNVGDMNEALDGVKADGLQGLEDGLAGVIDGTETVSSAFKRMASSIIADLTRIAVEKLILSVVGLKDGGAVSGSTVPGFALGGFPGFAGGASSRIGNLIRGPGSGTSDSILALVGGNRPIMVSNGEAIVNEAATKRHWPLIRAMNEGRLPAFATGGAIDQAAIRYARIPDARSLRLGANSAPAPIMFDLRGAVMTEDLLHQMNSISARHAQVSIVAGAQMAQHDIAEHQFQAIPQ